MLRSMYSGISAMKSNQTKMDVVGNNVANVGTTAYKRPAQDLQMHYIKVQYTQVHQQLQVEGLTQGKLV